MGSESVIVYTRIHGKSGFKGLPDNCMTLAVDWALKNNYLFIYLSGFQQKATDTMSKKGKWDALSLGRHNYDVQKGHGRNGLNRYQRRTDYYDVPKGHGRNGLNRYQRRTDFSLTWILTSALLMPPAVETLKTNHDYN